MRQIDLGILNQLALAAERHPQVVFSGPTAAWLHGLDLEWDPIEVTVADPHASIRAGLVVRRAPLPVEDMVLVQGLPATSPRRTAIDLGRRLKGVDGVVALDAALHAGLVDLAYLQAFVSANWGAKGIARLRTAVELADAATESPMETRLRVILMRGGLGRPETQVELLDRDGRFVGRTDLYYPEVRLAIEYDGGTHRDSLAEDDRRQNLILGAGYQLLRFTAGDLSRPDFVVAQVASALHVSARDGTRNAFPRRIPRGNVGFPAVPTSAAASAPPPWLRSRSR